MAQLAFEIEGAKGKVAVPTFQSALHIAFGVLREVDQRISGIWRGNTRWYIDDLVSDERLGVLVHSVPVRRRINKHDVPDRSAEIASSFVESIDDIENRAKLPPYLSEFAIARVGDLSNLIGKNGATGFWVGVPDAKQVAITERAYRNVEEILPSRTTTLGSVEGTLEAINLHRSAKVIVYSRRTKRAITCLIDQEKQLEEVKEALGQRVSISGELEKNVKGDTVRVRMRSIRRLGVDVPLVRRAAQLTDFEPDFADAPTTAEYIRRIRGG